MHLLSFGWLLLFGTTITVALAKDTPPTPSEDDRANWKCCLACQDAPQAIHPEPTVYPPECFTKCTYTVTKYTAAISKKCKCGPEQEAEAMKQMSQQEKAASGEDADMDMMPDAKDKMEGAMQPAPSSQESGGESSTNMSEMAGEAPPPMPSGAASPGAPMMGPPGGENEAAGPTGRVRRGMKTKEEAQKGVPTDRMLDKSESPALGNDGSVLTSDPTLDEEEAQTATEPLKETTRRKKRQIYNPRKLFRAGYDKSDDEEPGYIKINSRVRRAGSRDHGGCPDNPFKICKARPAPEPEEIEEERQDLVPNRHIGPCGRLGPGYLSAYGVNAKTEFRIIYRAKNLTYEVIFPSEIVDWENIDFDKYEKKRVTQIVRQKGGMEAIRKSTTFNTCACEDGMGPVPGGGQPAAGGLQVDELNRGGPIQSGVPAAPMPPQTPPQTAMMKERRQVYF